jgi:uncharacterized protein YdbL (DUF1318 family)
MSILKKITTGIAAMFAAAALMTAYAADPVIEQAKAQGLIGEKFDGYLGIVDAGRASADVKRRVDETNAGRLQVYTDIARKSGDPVSTVAAAMAEKNFARAESGEVLKAGPNDTWTKKP